MENALQMVLLVAGILFLVVGNIWFIVEGFKASILWGLGILFVPFVALFFLISHWREAKKPFLVEVVGIVLFVLSAVLAQGKPPV